MAGAFLLSLGAKFRRKSYFLLTIIQIYTKIIFIADFFCKNKQEKTTETPHETL